LNSEGWYRESYSFLDEREAIDDELRALEGETTNREKTAFLEDAVPTASSSWVIFLCPS
jgi:hypothetical protein